MPKPDPEATVKKMIRTCELLFHFGDQALARAKEETSPLRGRDYAGSGRSAKGVVGDQTGDVGASRADRGERALLYDRMVKGIADLDRQLSDVAGLFEMAITPVDEAEAKRKLRPAGSGDCGACGRWVTGQGEDRIKSGYCPRDHRKWLRTRSDGLSRSDFEHMVRSEEKDPNA